MKRELRLGAHVLLEVVERDADKAKRLHVRAEESGRLAAQLNNEASGNHLTQRGGLECNLLPKAELGLWLVQRAFTLLRPALPTFVLLRRSASRCFPPSSLASSPVRGDPCSGITGIDGATKELRLLASSMSRNRLPEPASNDIDRLLLLALIIFRSSSSCSWSSC